MFFQNQLLVLPVLQLRFANYCENPWLSLLSHCHKLLQHQCCWKLLGLQAYIKGTKSDPSGWKETSPCLIWQIGQCCLQRWDMKAEFAPFIRKVQLIPKLTGSDFGDRFPFYRLMTVATPCYWGSPHSPGFLVYHVLLPLSCSLFFTKDTRSTVFHGSSCSGTVIIWKENKARSLRI